MRFQRFTRNGVINLCLIIFNIDARMSQGRIVVGTERIEIISVDFAGSVASQQVILEKDTHLRYDGQTILFGSSDLNCRDQILLAVGAQHADREL